MQQVEQGFCQCGEGRRRSNLGKFRRTPRRIFQELNKEEDSDVPISRIWSVCRALCAATNKNH